MILEGFPVDIYLIFIPNLAFHKWNPMFLSENTILILDSVNSKIVVYSNTARYPD